MKKKCKHEPRIETVEDVFDGGIHRYHVNGDVCAKCGKLLSGKKSKK
jgi:hypothetical protein